MDVARARVCARIIVLWDLTRYAMGNQTSVRTARLKWLVAVLKASHAILVQIMSHDRTVVEIGNEITKRRQSWRLALLA